VVATAFGLAPPVVGAVICAKADGWAAPKITDIEAMDINVAVSIDLMTHPGTIEARAIKHICLVGNTHAAVQGILGTTAECRDPRATASPLSLEDGPLAASRRMMYIFHGSRRTLEKVIQDAECRRTRTLRSPYRAA
jgi:hypothetical protein